MELRIAPGKIDRITARRRRLIGKRREECDLGAGPVPSIELAGIDEGIGGVAGHGDALPKGLERGCRFGGGLVTCRPRQTEEPVEIQQWPEAIGEPIEEALDIL